MRVLALLLAWSALAAAEHSVLELKAPQKIAYRALRDIDGDGFTDLIAVTSTEAWIWRGRKGTLPAEPDARVALPKGAAFFDLGDLDPARPGEEILVRTAAAYWQLKMDGVPKKLPYPSGPGLPARPANVLWRGMTVDLDKDGKRDLVDVSLNGYTIHFGSKQIVTLPIEAAETTDTGARLASERYVARYALGAWTDGQFDADLIPDFAILRGDTLWVYPGDKDGRPRKERRFRIDLPEAATADLTFLDLDGNTKTDVIAVDRKAGTATIFFAHSGPGLRKSHRVPLKVPGRMRSPILCDFNGDGWKDLALPFYPTPNVSVVVQAALRGEVPIKVPIFLNLPTQRPSIRRIANTSITFPVRIRLRADAGGRLSISGLVIVEYQGDLDGDGRLDLVISKKPDLLAVHPGVPVTVFHEKARTTLRVPDATPYTSVASNAADLNGDGLSDIILSYYGSGKRADRLILLLSGKK